METTIIHPLRNPSGQEIFNAAAIEKYWNMSLPENLAQDETVRVVLQTLDPNNPDDKTNKQIWTPTEPYRNANDIMLAMNKLQAANPQRNVGISISTTVFNYTGQTPKTEEFKYTDTISIDIDTHIAGTKERYPLHFFDDDQIYYSILNTWVQMSGALHAYGIEPVVPKMTLLTGGGLQFILDFDKRLNQNHAKKIFGLLKSAIGKMVWTTSLRDVLGTFAQVPHDIDSSFSDIVHVQRCCGTINQKYGVMSKDYPLFEMTDVEISALKLRLILSVRGSTTAPDHQKILEEQIETNFKNLASIKPTTNRSISVDDNLITAKMQSVRTHIKPSQLKGVEHDLLDKLKKENIDLLGLMHGEVRIGPKTGNLTKLYCPFHEERNPSMAFYENELFDVIKDFHDDATYSFIAFWEKVYGVPKSDAIAQIAEKAGINLGKSERKEFQNLELNEIIDALVDRVDTDKFVFYRLANKNKTCVVRYIDSGEAFIFDGPKMLANHVLANHLEVDDAELALQDGFAHRFQQVILIDAFEEFNPGKPTIFQKQFIKFVNLWVPSERYKRVHIRAKEIREVAPDGYTIEETIHLLKRKTPWAYKNILQLVQNGDMHWFINWLSATSKFVTVPTVPVVFGVQGAGKNLFVNKVMDFYLNSEYIKTVSGDRIMQQFNSILESTSLLVLDEGDFSNGKEIDQLKLLTGNEKILIEKKGVDATNKSRHFNVLFFSNGEVPIRHPAMDRRITYFNNEIPLLASANVWGISIDEMIEKVLSEMVEFWAIIHETKLDHKMAMANCKNGQFWKQVLMQHPFGTLVVKLMNGDWEDIALQLNENVQERSEVSLNIKLLNEIRDQFEKNGAISLTLINRYLHSLNFKMKTSIQRFIQMNHLSEFGIHVSVNEDDVKIIVDRKKVYKTLKVTNVLTTAYPKTMKAVVSELEAELSEENAYTLADEVISENDSTSGELKLPPAPGNLSTN